MEKSLYWIGIQESEIDNVQGLFNGSITIFGSGKIGNYAFDKKFNLRFDYNKDYDAWFDFVNKSAMQIISCDPNCAFVLYYPMDAPHYCKAIQERLIAINDPIMLNLLDNKFLCREWLGNDISVLPTQVYFGEQIKAMGHDLLTKMKKIVLQGEYSCGGSETWLVSEDNFSKIMSMLSSNKRYSVTPYLDCNVPINIHLVIYQDKVTILPASVQVIEIHNYSFEYRGADFITYRFLPQNIKKQIKAQALIIGERMRSIGYRGVCGIDFIANRFQVYFCEINPRFQSSSFLLNLGFIEQNKKCSIQKLHLDAFEHPNCQYNLQNLEVNFSFIKLIYSQKNRARLAQLATQAANFNQCKFVDDGLSWDMALEENTYLYKLIFKQNICAVSPEFVVLLHPNLKIGIQILQTENWRQQILQLKIMLLSHGITMSDEAAQLLTQAGGINSEEFNALDLTLDHQYYMNIPYKTSLTELSPFKIDFFQKNLWLFVEAYPICQVEIRLRDPIAQFKTSTGIQYSEIAYLGQDRLRVYHRLGCYFQKNKCGCGFCDLENDNRNLSFTEIKEVIDAYDGNKRINHFLIGGGSQSPDNDFELVCQIAKYIKDKSGKPIYLMSIPPLKKRILQKLQASGITEVAFNLEIYDRNIAEQYMPGKGKLAKTTYFEALLEATKLWGKNGNVRSILIVGLEPSVSLLRGVKELCQIGVSPILSLFKPIPGTPLGHLLPPSDEEILRIVLATEDLCAKYNIPMGPTCRFCEDNTLKVTR